MTMAHKLTGQDLEYVANNMKDCKKDPLYKRRMVVRVYSANASNEMKSILERAFNPERSLFEVDGDVVLKFPYVWQRDEAVRDLNAAVDEYLATAYGPTPDPDTPTVPTNETETKTDYTTYIIIGAAAVVIIALLLWLRK